MNISGEFTELKGRHGEQGDKGKKGLTGDPFDVNDVSVSDNTITFKFNENQFQVQGVRGKLGERGDKGDVGDRGNHGLYPIHIEQSKITNQLIFYLDSKPKDADFESCTVRRCF